MRLKLGFSSLIIICAMLVAMPGGAFAKGPEKKVVNYVALGDSLAAGVTPDGAVRLGYPDYLASRYEQSQYTVDFKNFGAPGAKTEHLKLALLTDVNVQAAIQDADVITIDIGANDLLSVLGNPAGVQQTMTAVYQNLQFILQTIDSLNPSLQVYVMGYYNPFPHYPVEQQTSILPLLEELNNVIEIASTVNGDTYVPTEKVIAKQYKTYLPNPLNIHLSEYGYQQVAKEFWKATKRSS